MKIKARMKQMLKILFAYLKLIFSFLILFFTLIACSKVKSAKDVSVRIGNEKSLFQIEQNIELNLSSLTNISIKDSQLKQFFLQIERNLNDQTVIPLPLTREEINQSSKKIKLLLDPGEYKLTFFWQDQESADLFELCPKVYDLSRPPIRLFAQKNINLNYIHLMDQLQKENVVMDLITLRPELLYCQQGAIDTGIQGKIKLSSNFEHHFKLIAIENTSNTRYVYPLSPFKINDRLEIEFKILQMLPGTYDFLIYNDVDEDLNYSPCATPNQNQDQIGIFGFDDSFFVEIKNTDINQILDKTINQTEIILDTLPCRTDLKAFHLNFQIKNPNAENSISPHLIALTENQSFPLMMGLQTLDSTELKTLKIDQISMKSNDRLKKFNLYLPNQITERSIQNIKFWVDVDQNGKHDDCAFLNQAYFAGVDCWLWENRYETFKADVENLFQNDQPLKIPLNFDPNQEDEYLIWQAKILAATSLKDEDHPNRKIYLSYEQDRNQVHQISDTETIDTLKEIKFIKKIHKSIFMNTLQTISFFVDEDQNQTLNTCRNQEIALGDSTFLETNLPSESQLTEAMQDFTLTLNRQELCKEQKSKMLLQLNFPIQFIEIPNQTNQLIIQLSESDQKSQNFELSCLFEPDLSSPLSPKLICSASDAFPIGKYDITIKAFSIDVKKDPTIQIIDDVPNPSTSTIMDFGIDLGMDMTMDMIMPMTNQNEQVCLTGQRNGRIINRPLDLIQIELEEIPLSFCMQ
jgi:hypothetical protein